MAERVCYGINSEQIVCCEGNSVTATPTLHDNSFLTELRSCTVLMVNKKIITRTTTHHFKILFWDTWRVLLATKRTSSVPRAEMALPPPLWDSTGTRSWEVGSYSKTINWSYWPSSSISQVFNLLLIIPLLEERQTKGLYHSLMEKIHRSNPSSVFNTLKKTK